MNERDREMLDMAAKAAEVEIQWYMDNGRERPVLSGTKCAWNPNDDGDTALWLATRLHMMINIEQGETEVSAHPSVSADLSVVEVHNGDAAAATRRAIVRCAAMGVKHG